MQRTTTAFLENWLASADRKPMVIRGPRQVGKTWLVRHLAQTQAKKLIEILEVKAVSTGSLKSLHLFMGLRKWPRAVSVLTQHCQDKVMYR